MPNQSDRFQEFLNKEDVSILVVDSGLGGMAICADVARALPAYRHFKTVNLIYFNAWPEQDRGYNRLGGRIEQIDTFDKALNSMLQYKPDFIMLACNTLSVLYPFTDFRQNAKIPVIDIVDFGVNMIAQALQGDHKRQVVILGTVTTIASNEHHDRLVQTGIPSEQIVLQPCDQLATAIEKGPEMPRVADMIHTFLNEARLKIDPSAAEIYAALCCTHFGYCRDQFQTKLVDLTGKSATILNPNRQMTDYLLSSMKDRGFDTKQRIKVVSKIEWEPSKISAISDQVAAVSSRTARALGDYEQVPDLF